MAQDQRTQTTELPSELLPFVWHYVKPKKWQLFGYTIVAISWALEFSLGPYLMKVLIDTIVKYSANAELMLKAILIPAALYISKPLLSNFSDRLYQYINLNFYPAIKSAIGLDAFTYLLHHSPAFFENTFTGSLTKKIFDLGAVELLLSTALEWFYFRLFSILVASVTLFTVVHPIFGVILLLYAGLFIFFSYLASKKAEIFSREYSEAGAKVGGTISDSIANIINTKLFGNLSDEVLNVAQDINTLVTSDKNIRWYNLKISFLQGMGVTIFTACMVVGLIYGRMHEWVSVGDFALVLALSISFVELVYGIGLHIQEFSKAAGVCNQALSFVRVPHDIKDMPAAQPIDIKNGQIRFENVSFNYQQNHPLFTNLKLTINAGENVGLVGYSGGGKSTFIKLILRLIDPQDGKILIDNQDIKQVTKNSLRKQIGTIPQETELFHRTIMENIRFAKIDASDAEVIEAAKRARCHEFICELPEQYQSLVGERGVKLSGGQKQRIAIARAFLKNAPILLLDEATSALDSVTERYIKESLHEVMAHKTSIVIAHRLSTLQNMDRILVFVDGKIVQDGSLDSLLANKTGHFYKLWNMQAEGFIPRLMQ